MTAAMKKTGATQDICILAATSGDTGKAALEGFKDVPHTHVIVFYPKDGVSRMQALQMQTQTGQNCHVFGIDGSFDDAQTGVKTLFADQALADALSRKGIALSSANSINWGRLVSQIVYYVSVYLDLLKCEKLAPGQFFNVVVPTGNFGNILAAWYAKQMGIPIAKLVCASNRNRVLSDFLRSGEYDANRLFYQTNAPSMDILISSNLERMLFELTKRNAAQVSAWMDALKTTGKYVVDEVTRKRLQAIFVGGFCDDLGVIKTIDAVYEQYDHVIDPHTAIGFNVYGRYEQRAKDEKVVVFVSTASPFKFAQTVGQAIFPPKRLEGLGEQALMEAISTESDLPIPAGLDHLEDLPITHHQTIAVDAMQDSVLRCLGV